jgi:hypothetical protein
VFDLRKHKEIALAATKGPWQWFGNTKMHEVYLATVNRGRVFVMDFVRWGMRSAQPRFQTRFEGAPIDYGRMQSLGDLAAQEHPQGPKFEVPYRRQFQGIGHPDAEHIAANSPDVTLKLIERIERLEAAATKVVGGNLSIPELEEALEALSAVVYEGIP